MSWLHGCVENTGLQEGSVEKVVGVGNHDQADPAAGGER